MRITDVKINGIKNPLGFCYDYLNCSWRVTETASKKPAAAAVEVSASPDFGEILYRKEGADLSCSPGRLITYGCRLPATGATAR